MAKGTKNYFRHSMSAHENHKIMDLIKKAGKEAYFHYFTLVEICARQYVEKNGSENSFKFHASTLCVKLMVTRQRLGGHLLAIQSSLGGRWAVVGSQVEIEYDKIPEYLGSYNSSIPNIIKEIKKERKECEEKIPEKKPTKKQQKITEISSKEIVPEIIRDRVDLNNKSLERIKTFGSENCHKLFEKFPSGYIFDEVDTMLEWLKENPKRKFSYLFVLNWLKRGYDIEKHGPSELQQELHNLKTQKILEGVL